MEHTKIEWKECEIYKNTEELIIRSDHSTEFKNKFFYVIGGILLFSSFVILFNNINLALYLQINALQQFATLPIEIVITLFIFKYKKVEIFIRNLKRLEIAAFIIIMSFIYFLLNFIIFPNSFVITLGLLYNFVTFSFHFLILYFIIIISYGLLFRKWYLEWNFNYRKDIVFLFKKKFQSKHIEEKPLIYNNIRANLNNASSQELLNFKISQINSINIKIKESPGRGHSTWWYIVYFNISDNDNSTRDIQVYRAKTKKKAKELKKFLSYYIL